MRIALYFGFPLLVIMAWLNFFPALVMWGAKNDCTDAALASMKLSRHAQEKESRKALVDACKCFEVLGRSAERSMTGSSY